MARLNKLIRFNQDSDIQQVHDHGGASVIISSSFLLSGNVGGGSENNVLCLPDPMGWSSPWLSFEGRSTGVLDELSTTAASLPVSSGGGENDQTCRQSVSTHSNRDAATHLHHNASRPAGHYDSFLFLKRNPPNRLGRV